MTLRVEPARLKAQVTLPGSKSHANRFLIVAARTAGTQLIRALPESDDVRLLLAALKQIGLDIHGTNDVEVRGQFPACEERVSGAIEIDVGEGGTTARFLAALLARGRNRYHLKLHGRLAERPWSELLEALVEAGAKAELRDDLLVIQGPLRVADLPRKISAKRSTQFASALALAFSDLGYRPEATELATSQPYWQLTQEILARPASAYQVPADWSSAAYPLVFAALHEDAVDLPDLRPDAQADALLFKILEQRRAAVEVGGGIRISRLSDRSPLTLDVSPCPDLAPALAYLCSHLSGESRLRGVSVLRHKESDRLTALLALLAQVGVEASYAADADQLVIRGGFVAKEFALTVPADHRLVMTGALFLLSGKGGTISHPEAVRKSFPKFFEIFTRGR